MPVGIRTVKVELPLEADDDFAVLLEKFEAQTLPYQHWTHRAHLAVGIGYIRRMPLPAALDRIRDGINAYNRVCGNPDGYNETVTIMFLRRIAAEYPGESGQRLLRDELAQFSAMCTVDWLYQYYSRELIWSREAKSRWVEPDVKPLDF